MFAQTDFRVRSSLKPKNMEQNELKIGRYANVLMDRWFKRTFG